jgi:hypothetical protein
MFTLEMYIEHNCTPRGENNYGNKEKRYFRENSSAKRSLNKLRTVRYEK